MRGLKAKRIKAKAKELTEEGMPYSAFEWKPQRSNKTYKDDEGKEHPVAAKCVVLVPGCTRQIYQTLKRVL